MNKRTITIITIATLVAMSPLSGATAEAICPTPGEVETVRYTWQLRGGLAWIAAIAFPTSGTASLLTSERPGAGRIETELTIQGSGSNPDFYRYESEIDDEKLRTLMTFHGYTWGRKEKEERTRLDYRQGRATTVKRSYKSEKARTETESIPDRDLRDILTGIYFLRTNADTIVEPIPTDIYSDGKLYPVLYQPLGKKVRAIGSDSIETVGFRISARPGEEKKWPGGVEVWLTNDGRGIPVMISINQRFATMELELSSASCDGRELMSRR